MNRHFKNFLCKKELYFYFIVVIITKFKYTDNTKQDILFGLSADHQYLFPRFNLCSLLNHGKEGDINQESTSNDYLQIVNK